MFAAGARRLRKHGCQRAILVGHNAHFDLNFLNAAVARCGHKRNPFHPFSVFDTVTLAGVAYGQTVLARAVQAAGLEWNSEEAHSAVYDTERTAQLFCKIVNGVADVAACALSVRSTRGPTRRSITADRRCAALTHGRPLRASPVSVRPGPRRSARR